MQPVIGRTGSEELFEICCRNVAGAIHGTQIVRGWESEYPRHGIGTSKNRRPGLRGKWDQRERIHKAKDGRTVREVHRISFQVPFRSRGKSSYFFLPPSRSGWKSASVRLAGTRNFVKQ